MNEFIQAISEYLKQKDYISAASEIIGMARFDPDMDLIQTEMYKLAEHPNHIIRGDALLALGYVVMRFKDINLRKAVPLIKHGLSDNDQFVRTQAINSSDMFIQYLDIDIRTYEIE